MRRMQRPGVLSPPLLTTCRMIGRSPRSHSKLDDGNHLSKYRPVASFHQQHRVGMGHCLFSGAISGLRARSDCLSKVTGRAMHLRQKARLCTSSPPPTRAEIGAVMVAVRSGRITMISRVIIVRAKVPAARPHDQLPAARIPRRIGPTDGDGIVDVPGPGMGRHRRAGAENRCDQC
jgi:hypothetical protein